MNFKDLIAALEEKVREGLDLIFDEALALMTTPDESLMDLLAPAGRITEWIHSKQAHPFLRR